MGVVIMQTNNVNEADTKIDVVLIGLAISTL